MKPILYRAKAINRNPNMNYRTDYQNGDWVYGLVSKLYKYDDKYFAEMTNTDGVSGIDVDPETICEFTGLTGKNGKKIFEGDIVQAPSNLAGTEFYIGTIEFGNFSDYSDNIYTGFFIKWKNVPEYSTLRQSIIWWRDEQDRFLNIIGNIYDNPELLEK